MRVEDKIAFIRSYTGQIGLSYKLWAIELIRIQSGIIQSCEFNNYPEKYYLTFLYSKLKSLYHSGESWNECYPEYSSIEELFINDVFYNQFINEYIPKIKEYGCRFVLEWMRNELKVSDSICEREKRRMSSDASPMDGYWDFLCLEYQEYDKSLSYYRDKYNKSPEFVDRFIKLYINKFEDDKYYKIFNNMFN